MLGVDEVLRGGGIGYYIRLIKQIGIIGLIQLGLIVH